jgi:hypothetical protein
VRSVTLNFKVFACPKNITKDSYRLGCDTWQRKVFVANFRLHMGPNFRSLSFVKRVGIFQNIRKNVLPSLSLFYQLITPMT